MSKLIAVSLSVIQKAMWMQIPVCGAAGPGAALICGTTTGQLPYSVLFSPDLLPWAHRHELLRVARAVHVLI